MKLRWKILIGIGIFLLIAFVSTWFGAHHRPQSEVEAYKQFLREYGEKLEISELIPPTVPEESNCADSVRMAFGSLSSVMLPSVMRMVAPAKAMAAWQQPDVRGYDGTSSEATNSWDTFAADVTFHRPALDLLKEVFNRPKLDFNLDYKRGADMPIQHLASFKRSAQALMAAAVLDLHNGDTGAAATNICTILALVRADHEEPVLISHLVRIAMVAITVTPTWEFLQSTNASDAQLEFLQKNWEQMSFLDDATNAFTFERASSINEIQKLRTSNEEMNKYLGLLSSASSSSGSGSIWDWPPDWEAITEKPRNAVGMTMWRASWSYSDELRTLKSEQIILEALRSMETNQNGCFKTNYDAMQSKLSSVGITNAGQAFFRALKIPDLSDVFGDASLGAVVRKTISIETARRVVVTAIALKRFQLKYGKWPDKLDDLAPEFFEAVPIDPYDGKPLHYHPNEDGTYLLYSVGEDGVDDGGDPTLPAGISSSSLYWQNNRARDWVWPQPATDAEIKYFYAHPPK